MKTLDLANFPLHQHALIEASAGTGKTYAVSNLYLRYLIDGEMDVSQILVVTFTEAATQELKDRIRSRIKELIVAYENEQSDDELLDVFLNKSSSYQKDIVRLRLAERSMDEAQIYTIHGFCQMVLKKYAIELGIPTQQTLVEDEYTLRKSAVEDFWRKSVLSLPEEYVSELSAIWAGPEALIQDISPLLDRSPDQTIPSASVNGMEGWLEQVAQVAQWYADLRREIRCVHIEARKVLEESQLKLLKNRLQWWDQIGEWCEKSGVGVFPGNSSRSNFLFDFVPEELALQTKKNGKAPSHAIFDKIAGFLEGIPEPLKESFIVQAAREVAIQVSANKAQQSLVSFDDLIKLLYKAITDDQTKTVLCDHLRSVYRVGMIDEFQDTDKFQYTIFSEIFVQTSTERSTDIGQDISSSLVLIGDPKQAIYSFRGGDIATYLKAKTDIQQHVNGELYTMDTNWRSVQNMVESVNYLFSRPSNTFLNNQIPFTPVQAAKANVDQDNSAMHVSALMLESTNKAQISHLLAERCVQQIVSLIEDCEQAPSLNDIAVLVRSASEADLIKNTLNQYGLSASYEGKSYVFESEEAEAICLLLKSVCTAHDERMIRRCLSSMYFGQDDDLLTRLVEEDRVLTKYMQIFSRLQSVWLKHGVLAMVRSALHEFDLYRFWHRPENNIRDWERRLSNLNQLAELLQSKSRTIWGIETLCRWFERQIVEGMDADAEGKIRLESDEKLIKIITIHKSKGLEFPYVFLPFIYYSRAASEYWFYDRNSQLTLDLLKKEGNQASVERERLAEDLRLLYVALTRSKIRCFIGTTFYKGTRSSLGVRQTAWGYLAYGNDISDKTDAEDYMQVLERLQKDSQGLLTLESLTLDQITECSEAKTRDKEIVDGIESDRVDSIQQRLFTRSLVQKRKVHSFTGLMQEHHRIAGPALESGKNSEASVEVDDHVQALERCEDELSIFDFPKGSRAGTFLHELFEEIEFSSAKPRNDQHDSFQTLDDLIEFKLSRLDLVEEEKLTSWKSFLSSWVRRVLSHRFTSDICLSRLSEDEYFPELDFYFDVASLNATKLNRLLNSHGYRSVEFEEFSGYMKGAIDLVLKAEDGKYYLLDYKSNYLGDKVHDYSLDSMQLAIEDHRYDIQYLLYTLAFHRFLSHRLGQNYSYERNFGGVLYVFLRGLNLNALAGESADNMNSGLNDELNSGRNDEPNGGLNEELAGVYRVLPDEKLIHGLDKLVSVDGN